MTKKTTKILLATIILIGVFLRFWQLGSNPPGLTWDEASLGYNAYSILQTGKDEYGTAFPVSFRSFDDYKPPAYVYLTVPFVALFDLNEYSVRLVSAIAGSLTVLVVYFLTKEILYVSAKKKRQYLSKSISYPPGISYLQKIYYSPDTETIIALLASFFVAVSPWSIQHSRAAFEGNLGLFFFSFGALFLFRGIRNKWYFVAASLSMVFAMYSYHSFRVTIPAFVLMFAILYWRRLWDQKIIVTVAAVLFVSLTFPIAYDVLSSSEGTGSRLSLVTRFGDPSFLDPAIARIQLDRERGDAIGGIFHNRRLEIARTSVMGYLDHYNPDFLFLTGDGGKHHHAVEMGNLFIWELLFIVLGFSVLLFYMNRRIGLLFIWLLAAPLASSITTGTPHAVRGIAMLIPFHMFTAVGVYFVGLVVFSFKNKFIKWVVVIVGSTILVGNFYYYVHQYFVHTPIEYSDYWQSANRQLYEELAAIEDEYDTIITSYHYDQPYIYYLFFNKIDPIWYQSYWHNNGQYYAGRFRKVVNKYDFKQIDWNTEKDLKNTLVVATPQEATDDFDIVKTISFPNGNPAYLLYEVNMK